IHDTPGYSATHIGELMLLWCTRPRISWFAALLVFVEKEKSMYFSLGASALLSETILQIFTGVYLGRTLRFAAKNDLYENRLYDILVVSHGKSAMVMCVGAVIWFIAIFGALVQIIWTFSGVGQVIKNALSKKTKRVVERATTRFENEV